MECPLLILDSGATYLYNKFVKKNREAGLFVPRWRIAKWKEKILYEEDGFNLLQPSDIEKLKKKTKPVRGEQHGPGTHFINRVSLDFTYYKTNEFRKFRDSYIRFIKKHSKYLYAYINLDVINNAEESYKSLKYMESKGCHPLPVFHIGNDVKWLKRYIKEGYQIICIGGISPNRFSIVQPILDEIWLNVLTDSKGMPIVKAHGLACTSYDLLTRYPWWGVDSASWTKMGGWGGIYIPRKKEGEFGFDKSPFALAVSNESPRIKIGRKHFYTISKRERDHVKEWLNTINVPVGSIKKGIQKPGVTNDYQSRMRANLFYFQALSNSLPKWPWALRFHREGLFA